MSIVERFLLVCLVFEKLAERREGRHFCERIKATHFSLILFRVNIGVYLRFEVDMWLLFIAKSLFSKAYAYPIRGQICVAR